MRKILVTTICTVVLSLVGAASATATTDTMGQARAGNYYLKSVCPERPALNRLDRALPVNSKGWWRTKDLTPRVFRRVKATSRHLSSVYYQAARHLYNPPAA